MRFADSALVKAVQDAEDRYPDDEGWVSPQVVAAHLAATPGLIRSRLRSLTERGRLRSRMLTGRRRVFRTPDEPTEPTP